MLHQGRLRLWLWHALAQVDEGYPAETIMMHKGTLRMIFFFGNSQLVKPWPLTHGYTTDDGGSKLGERKYSFKTRDVTPNITVGDLVAVSHPIFLKAMCSVPGP